MNFYVAMLLVIFADALIDGMKDGLSFRKGNLDLKHISHFLKHVDRVLLVGLGYFFCKVIGIAQIFSIQELIGLAIGIIMSFAIGKMAWYFTRYNTVEKLFYLDEHVDLSFGWGALDLFLGFDKPIPLPCWRWFWRK